MRSNLTPASQRRHWTLPILNVAILALVIITGCRATTQEVVTYGNQLPRPQRVVVYDFTSTPGEVHLESGLVGRLEEHIRTQEGTPMAEQEAKLQAAITRIMTAQLVQEIRKLGVPVESAAAAGPVTEGELSIEGQFLTIDEGNRARRLVIGLGAGASHVRVAVQVLETIAGQHRLAEDFYTNANSSRKPGFGPMAGAGAAAGAATAVTAGIGLGATVLMGPQDAENDAKQAAVAVTRELAQFFAKQGWITYRRNARTSPRLRRSVSQPTRFHRIFR
jgi:Domain of unknown function (DUF4410)